ncbi:MAG TPA: sigma-54 dependent transcriptional regulator [Nitrospiraceae bacterium]|nr:sigma-54 dependent transcriptional regulator [Nitrospiraceae bacterium]
MHVLIVEDQEEIRDLFGQVIRSLGHQVTACADGESGWKAYEKSPYHLVLLDWELGSEGMDGLQLCRKIRADQRGDRCVIVMITAHNTPDNIRAALQAGANDYLVKPLGPDLLRLRLSVAEQWVESLTRRFEAEDKALELERRLANSGRFFDLVGQSSSMTRLYAQIREIAAVDSTVLIEGETGTGKELVARAIHSASRRKDQPFIAVNCAGFTESILGSQLFGHKKGAFTGAIDTQEGVFEAAHGGTIFLDEIGDVPPGVQTNLLRVLQEREITRLGEAKPRKVDVRVLAATHHRLTDDVERGTFRRDLLYRIRVARIQIAPLRERSDDVPILAYFFLGQFRSIMEKPVHQISDEAMRALSSYAWPGNVRELKSAVESAVIHCKGSMIQYGDLPPEIIAPDAPTPARREPSVSDERTRILIALRQANGNRSEAARLLGMSRRTFYRRLLEYDLPLTV